MSVKLDLYKAIKIKLLSLTIDELILYKQTEINSLSLYKQSELEQLLILKQTESNPNVIATFGHWNNQFSEIENEIQFRFPAVFVEFSSIDWSTDVKCDQTNQTQQQRGQCDITLHIGLKNLNKEDTAFEQDIVIVDNIVQQLNTIQGENFTPLVRISEGDDTNKGNIRDWTVRFRTNIHETGIYTDQIGQLVTLKLNTNYE